MRERFAWGEIYELPSGVEFAFLVDDGMMHPMLGGGVDPALGLYVSFNYTYQQILASGAGAGLAVAICVIPAVGWAACAIATAIVAAATAAVVANGLCGPGRELRIYIQQLGYPECQ